MIPGLSTFPEGQIIAFALVLMRIIAFVVSCPIIGATNVPVTVKVLLSLTLTIILFPTLHFNKTDLLSINDQLIFLVIREIFVGLALGYLMRMFFFAINVAGELISLSMGLSAAQMFNPALGIQVNTVEQFELMLATLFFLAVNGHHVFIGGLAESFHFVPLADIAIKVKGFSAMAVVAQDVLVMGLKISAPIIIAIFITNITMGIVGRAVPQINVLVTSMPITVLLGFAVLFVVMPLFVSEMNYVANSMAERFFQFMKVM